MERREERVRLRQMVTGILPKDSGGVIVRTVGEEVTQDTFKRELESLLKLWKKIVKKQTFVRAPALIQRETSLTRGIIRDLFSAKVDHLAVDERGRPDEGLLLDDRSEQHTSELQSPD